MTVQDRQSRKQNLSLGAHGWNSDHQEKEHRQAKKVLSVDASHELHVV